MNFFTLFFILLTIFSLYKFWKIKKNNRVEPKRERRKKNIRKSMTLPQKNFFKSKKKPKTSLENFLDNSIEWPKSVPKKSENKDPILSDKNANFKIPSTISSVRDSFDLKRISLDSIDFHRNRIIKKFK